jgi:hypothetical protein
MWSFGVWMEANLCRFYFRLYCSLRSSCQEGRVRIPWTGLLTSFFRACPKPGHVTCHGLVCAQRVQLRWEVIVCFVDIGWIGDHHCLNFLFIIWTKILSIPFLSSVRQWQNIFQQSVEIFRKKWRDDPLHSLINRIWLRCKMSEC